MQIGLSVWILEDQPLAIIFSLGTLPYLGSQRNNLLLVDYWQRQNIITVGVLHINLQLTSVVMHRSMFLRNLVF